MNRHLFNVRQPATAAFLWATALLVSPVGAHESAPGLAGAPAATASITLSEAPAPLSARYRVKVTPRAKPTVQQVWYFHRDGQRVALLKGAIDEVWHRDAQGRVSFERVFHEDQRAVDYSAGELATLGVSRDWAALSSLVDSQTLANLRPVARHGAGMGQVVVLAGRAGGDVYRIEWQPALQLPLRMLRTERDGRRTELVLERQFPKAPGDWPAPGQRSADYLRLDAADFGDMEYDPVVRKAEALDIRLGWRTAHQHD
jgi:hypothetical protein